MNMRSNLLAGTAMTPVERAQGRFMRGPGDEDQGGGHNQGGNAGGGAESLTPPDNSGDDKEVLSFWDQPQEGGQGGGGIQTPPSAPPGTVPPAATPPGTPPANPFATALQAEMSGIQFTPAIDEATAKEIGEGNFESFNKRIAEAQAHGMRQAVQLSTKVVAEYGRILQGHMKTMIQDAMGGAKNNETLESAFPSAKDPLVRPMVQNVFDQALKRSGGDRDKAVTLTRKMLQRIGGSTASDIDYTMAPKQPGDSAPMSADFTEIFNLRPPQ